MEVCDADMIRAFQIFQKGFLNIFVYGLPFHAIVVIVVKNLFHVHL